MDRNGVVFLGCLEEMLAHGKKVGESLLPGSVLALSGDLGAGKTTFVQGVALGLQINQPIQSPTFVYFNQYEGSLPLFHFDLYRMNGPDDFLGLGFEEYFDAGGVCAIEWSERIQSLLPQRTLHISFSYQECGRCLVFTSFSTAKSFNKLL